MGAAIDFKNLTVWKKVFRRGVRGASCAVLVIATTLEAEPHPTGEALGFAVALSSCFYSAPIRAPHNAGGVSNQDNDVLWRCEAEKAGQRKFEYRSLGSSVPEVRM